MSALGTLFRATDEVGNGDVLALLPSKSSKCLRVTLQEMSESSQRDADARDSSD